MPSIMPELVENFSPGTQHPQRDHKPGDTLARPRYKDMCWQGAERQKVKNSRLPYIHKRDGFDFHFLNMPPWENHVAVPS